MEINYAKPMIKKIIQVVQENGSQNMEASIKRYFATKDRNKIVKYLLRSLFLVKVAS